MSDLNFSERSRLAKSRNVSSPNTQPEARRTLQLGILVYATASIALGLIGLISGEFAEPWQPGLKAVPKALALVAALGVLGGGVTVQWRRSSRLGLVVLTLLNLVYTLIWFGQCILHWDPTRQSNWLNLAEQLTLLLAPILAFTCLGEQRYEMEVKAYHVARVLFGLCAVAFGLAHFVFLTPTARFAPQWLPLGPRFWALATGVGHSLAGIAIITQIKALLASRLLVAMILSFGALIWAPSLVAHPESHLFWAGNAINLAIAASAWVMADAIVCRQRWSPNLN